MKRLRKGLVALLIMALTVSNLPAMSLMAADTSTKTVIIGNARGDLGDKVQVSLSFDSAVTLQSMAISELDYGSSKLELVDGEWIAKGLLSDWNGEDGVFTFEKNQKISGRFFVFTFKIIDDVEVGETPITCTVDARAKNEGGYEESLNVSVKAGDVFINCSSHTWNDGKVTKKATTSNTGVRTYTCKDCAATKTSTIHKISSAALSTTQYTYNGSAKSPSVTVKDSKGKKLVKGTDYTYSYSSSSRKSIGRYSVKITFKGAYSGTKTLYYTIGPKNPSSVQAVLYGYDDVKVSWSKVLGASGYKVYYKKSTSDSWSSKSTTNTSMKLSGLTDGVKYDIKVVTYKKVSGNTCYNGGKSTSIYTLKKITGVKVAKSGSKVKVSWTNISGETGYQISKSTKKSGTSIVSTYSTTSGKFKTISATKKKTYYYKVRAYKTVNGKKIYGPWSSAVKYVRK